MRQEVKELAFAIEYYKSLEKLKDAEWNAPLKEGSWTIAECVGHLYMWDRYYYDHAISKLPHEKLTLVEHDYDEFNRLAAEYAHHITQHDLLKKAVEVRRDIIEKLEKLSDAEYEKKYEDRFRPKGFAISFSDHDTHHQDQIDAALARLNG
ncbi:DinB family protein [Exiguobacterium flavidum]|uniref:DinB family protein n=1 Tax=Exiguobacterium flavidum TaxID=2184695 RepID=UPI000DF7FDB9|nr:DinB family protein [Exiguobacterium flavidum]